MTTSHCNVKHENGTTWLDGLGPPEGEQLPGAGAPARLHHHCMRYMGLRLSEAWVRGATGDAFEMNVYRDALCQSGPTLQHDGHAGAGSGHRADCGARGRGDGPSRSCEDRTGAGSRGN